MNTAEQTYTYDLALWCGKTSPEPLAPPKETKARTSKPSLKKPSKSSVKKLPLFLSLKTDGRQPDASPTWEENGALLGEFSMHSFGESPKDVKESHLSQILEDSPHPKYCLSARACLGILNRADRKGKILPPKLREALERQSRLSAWMLDVNGGNPSFNQGGIFILEKHPSDSRITLIIDNKEIIAFHITQDLVNSESVTPCISAGSTHGQATVGVCIEHIVRRLTPLECERLQGLPDSWTDIGAWEDTDGKQRKKSADSARYKAIGNSIALPPWEYVLQRLSLCCGEDTTMASLFDGIGGFPLIWERLNGKGSCLWASEIEEFPIAVTKQRFKN